ncbi:hypothetical protein EGP99_00910 [bacterium]|nr:hypothetical protein [bacterium]
MAFRLNEKKRETENKTIRFPLPLINKIEKELSNTNITFSRFVIQACEYALENIEERNDKNDSKSNIKNK